MDYESASPGHTHTYLHTHMAGGGRRAHITATLEEQLLSYSENVENEGEEEEYLEEEVLQVDMATLAEQIIEATPERIKQEDFPRGAESPLRERRDNPAIQDTWLATYLDTVDAHTHSPPRRVCPPSPLSALALQRLRPPSSAAWAEFLNASANGKMERDFALLTLTDGEQRELYEAARIIQNAFRKYKVVLRAEAFPAEPAGGGPHPAVLSQLQGVREAQAGAERGRQPQPQNQVRTCLDIREYADTSSGNHNIRLQRHANNYIETKPLQKDSKRLQRDKTTLKRQKTTIKTQNDHKETIRLQRDRKRP
ncbi:Calmodulin-binding transcription activator 2 [Larimichthys crocea]|nr:Calmodulin-binding transcription activator 2 [Larimichthys crocea]